MTTMNALEDLKRSLEHRRSRHPVNQIHYDNATFGERLADRIAAGIGSWVFLIVQTIGVLLWVGLNIAGFLLRWDRTRSSS